MNLRLFFSVQILFIAGAFAYLCWAPRNYVATAIVQISYHVASPVSADELKNPADVQFGGTIARGFMNRRVLEEVVRKHSAAAVTAEWIQENCAVTPSRLNRTITLRLKSRRAVAACEILLALVEERLRMDVITQTEADQPLIEGVFIKMEDLRLHLIHAREALQQRVAQIGDPFESGVRWQESTNLAMMLDRTNIDLQKRISQARHRTAVLEAGLAGSARGLPSSEFAGYESFDRNPRVQANFDSTGDFPWPRSSNNSALLKKGDTAPRRPSYQLGDDHGIHREPERTGVDLQGHIYQTKNKLADVEEDVAGTSHRASGQDLTVSFDSFRRQGKNTSRNSLEADASIADASVSVLLDSAALALAESKRGAGMHRLSKQQRDCIKAALHRTRNSSSKKEGWKLRPMRRMPRCWPSPNPRARRKRTSRGWPPPGPIRSTWMA